MDGTKVGGGYTGKGTYHRDLSSPCLELTWWKEKTGSCKLSITHPPTTINTSDSNRQQQTVTGTGEMAQLAKCLLGKSEDMTSDI